MRSNINLSNSASEARATVGSARTHRMRLSPLDVVFRALAALSVAEIVTLAYQLAARPGFAGIAGQPYIERAIIGLIVSPAILMMGAFLLWRVPGNVVPRFIILIGMFASLGQFEFDLGSPALTSLAVDLVVIFATGLVMPSLGYLMLHFPTGQVYPTRLAPWLRLAAVAKFLGVVLEVITSPGNIKVFRVGVNPLFVPSLSPYQGLIAASVGITGILLPLILLGGMSSLLLRFRAAPEPERAQIRWVVGGFALLLAMMLTAVVTIFNGEPNANSVTIVVAFAAAALLGFVASVAVAIMRYHLYGIERLVNRTLVYGALSACVVGLYVIVVGALSALLQTGSNLVISLVATGLIAVLFQPLRERLQRGVNHLLYGEREKPYAVLSRLGERLEATPAPDAVLPAIVESVAVVLKLPYAAIALATHADRPDGAAGGQPAEFRIPAERTAIGHSAQVVVAAYGRESAPITTIPLVYQGESMGELRLAPRAGEAGFDHADLRLLTDLARQVGVAAHAVRLSADLQRSRERIVTAREEERRRIRRDLHDGLGPALAGITLKLDAARNLAERDAGATIALLAELRVQAQGAISDIRRLVYDLRPPALDELGLVSALHEYATRLSGEGLHIMIEAGALPPLPAAVEVAAYRIVTEALTNIVRHAHARSGVVRLSAGDALQLEILDDGAGLPDGLRVGMGLTSMRERAAELGGTFTVESLAAGGTRVAAWLPLN